MTGDTTAAATSEHNGVLVVRDDLYTGGTKARFVRALFDGADEVVYASPAEGGAQTALCTVAGLLGKRATIFVAKRTPPHPRVLESKRLGGKVMQVTPGYLTVVQARAKAYCAATGARLAPFGFDIPEAEETISQTALNTLAGANVKEIWCAYGSGTLLRALHKAFPTAFFKAVAVGRAPEPTRFFVELIDTTNFKCYGTQEVAVEKLAPTRVIGVYGRETRTFTEPFEVERGPKIVSVRASAAKPVVCWEHVYPIT